MCLLYRLAIVTGGGNGIGRAVCHSLARYGAENAVADVSLEAARGTVAEMKGEATHLALQLDVGTSSSVASLINHVKSRCKRPLSIFVHCAGVGQLCDVVDMPEDVFDEQLTVNLKGTFLVNQAAVKIMLKSKILEGCIVNMTRIMGKSGFAHFSAYAASKGGVIAFTKSLAQELAGSNIRVNALLPGPTDTALFACLPEDLRIKSSRMSLLRRFARPEEVADVARYLCSPASSYITGTSVEVAGGIYA